MSARPSVTLYSASQVAAALGRSKRGVLIALKCIPSAGPVMVRGQRADGWHLAALPARLATELEAVARARGYRSPAHLLTAPPERWEPKIDGRAVTLSEVAEHCVSEAGRLQRALEPTLGRLSDPAFAAEATEARGLQEFKAVFGYRVTPRHWRRMVERTFQRDRGSEDFKRLEIYLPDKLARRATAKPGYGAAAAKLENLRGALVAVKWPTDPTNAEVEFVWDQAFCELQWATEEGATFLRAKRVILKTLAASGVRLAKNPDALGKSFRRKWKLWLAGGCKPSAIMDARPLKSGNFKEMELPAEDRELLIARAVERGGRISQAWRETRERGELSQETADRFIVNPANKSHVPSAIRGAIRHDVAMLEDIHHGPRQAKLNGAWIPRDHSDYGPGDWFQGDDATFPVYYYEETPEGVKAMRGQLLPLIDCKTTYIFGYALHSERNYNARVIRSLITRVHDSYGLPRQGFYFENGIWRSARLLKGRPADEVTLQETEQGLREFVRFRHAKLPRAKVIEGVLGVLQNEIEAEPGYVGRDERSDRYERIQKQLLEAARGKRPYQDFLHSKAQWEEKLTRVFEEFNLSPQDGRLKGLSPREVYERDFNYQDGLVKLPAQCRYLLANHRRIEKVTSNGIRLVFGGDPYYYRSHDTGRLIGRQVLVWHDLDENPRSVTITDLDRRNPVEVPRVTPVPAMTATAEQLRVAMAQAEAHNAYAKTLYRIIQPRFARSMFRPVLVDAATVELGQKINVGREQAQVEQKRGQDVRRRIQTHSRELGINTPKATGNLDRKARGLEMLREANAREQQREDQAL